MVKLLRLSVILAALLLARAYAQQQNEPALMACGTHDDVRVVCGTRAPEDLELAPDGKYVVVSPFVSFRGAASKGMGLQLFDLAKQAFSPLPATAEPRADWGDPACPGPIGDGLAPHGISLRERTGGALQLYVVNHGGRESIEMFELQPAAGSWRAVWHGCVVTKHAYNDVAALADGGYVATQPEALGAGGNIFDGKPTGYVVRWSRDGGERELPGTRSGYPNGVLADRSGRYVYYDAWTVKQVHKYDLEAGKDASVARVDFMPDNITWTPAGGILAAGIEGASGECPAGSGVPCIQAFGIAAVDPAAMGVRPVYRSARKPAPISGVSVALDVGAEIYIGAFQGNRLVAIPAR